MKARDALFAWTPVSWDSQAYASTRGKVKIGPLIKEGDIDWTDHPAEYAFTGGAKSISWRRESDPMRLLAMIFIEFHAMVVRDGIAVAEAHRVFLAIDEYREAIAPDIEGSSDPADWFGGII